MIKFGFNYLYGIFTGGLLFLKFYEWFATPVFKGLPEISYYQAIGLSTFLYLFNQIKSVNLYNLSEKEADDNVKYGKYIIVWVALGLGFLTHLIIK